MKIEEATQLFLQQVKRSSESLGNYSFNKSHLSHFQTWSSERGLVSIMDTTRYDVIDDYIDDMRKTCSSSTINKRIGCLKRMYQFHQVDFKYLYQVKKLRERVTTYEMVEEHQLKKIRAYVKALDDSKGNNLLYKSIILLLSDTGVRLSELLQIEKDNVNLRSQEILLVTTKTKEDRTVFLSDTIIPVLKKMLTIKSDHKYLLHNMLADRPVNGYDIQYLMNKLKRKLGIKKLHSHMFRHSVATIWLQHGADIKTVMDFLGHKNMETTQRYQHSKKEHAKKVYREKFNLD